MTFYQSSQISQIFFPLASKQSEEVKNEDKYFAYYTTAETACSIIKNKVLWMRNTSTMNDYREVLHGAELLMSAFEKSEAAELWCKIDNLFPCLSDEAKQSYFDKLPTIQASTYITCFTEHEKTEDEIGRLSMWRAYGGNTGVALIFKPDVFLKDRDVGIYATPVSYGGEEVVLKAMKEISKNVQDNEELVRLEGRSVIKKMLLNMFRFAVLGLKHPGFKEELEWRLISCPDTDTSTILKPKVQVVRGTPQVVQLLQLDGAQEQDITLVNMLDRIIIGPCEHPEVIKTAMTNLLIDADFADPSKLVRVSNIPFRF